MTIDDFSKHLIEKAVTELSEKSKCNHSGAGSACPVHGDADCNSSKQNRAEEFAVEAKNKEGKEQGADGKACWKGYKYAGTENGKDKCVKAGYELDGEEELSERKDMPGNQEKIDANKNGKVDAHDFALLRAKKGKKSVKEMWEIAEATKKKVEIEIMPDVDTPNDPEPPTGKKAEKKKMKEEKEGADKKAENKFHTKLDKLVHKTFGSSSDEKKMKKEEVEPLEEKKLSKAEAEKKEKFVKGMKKKYGSFKSKYGERAKEVMYATATKMGKKAA
jgi:hypothetical protein